MELAIWNDIHNPSDVGPGDSPLLKPMRIDYQKVWDSTNDTIMLGLEGDSELNSNDFDSFMSEAYPTVEVYPRLNRTRPAFPIWDPETLRYHSRMDLPMKIHDSIIMSRPNTGCDENILSARVASQLGLFIDKATKHRKVFRIANGRAVQAIGLVSASCSFPNEPWKEMTLDFYVFHQLITPLIMGMSFLEDTQTLVENRHRLQARTSVQSRPSQISRLNQPKRWLRCIVAPSLALANPDTGSDVDLMSLSYVTKRQFELEQIDKKDSEVEFADGSIGRLVGKVTIPLALCSDNVVEAMTFYVLKNLTCDILFGEEFLQVNEIFQKHKAALTIDETHTSTRTRG